jgi:hypothetical protein
MLSETQIHSLALKYKCAINVVDDLEVCVRSWYGKVKKNPEQVNDLIEVYRKKGNSYIASLIWLVDKACKESLDLFETVSIVLGLQNNKN